MKPGIYDISNNEYHNSAGISRSGIMKFKKSPYHYWDEYINPSKVKKTESTPAMVLGEAVHTYLLENSEFDKRYAIEKKVDKRTKAGQVLFAEMQIKNAGKTVIDVDMYDKMMRMADNFYRHEYGQELVKGAEIEKSIYWQDCTTNELVKARPDILHNNMFCDLKTSSDASPHEFQRSIGKYGYHLQAAIIQDGVYHIKHTKLTDFIFIVIESVEPYAVAVYILDAESIEKGLDEYKFHLKNFRDYKELNLDVWHGYKTQTISLPSYYSY